MKKVTLLMGAMAFALVAQTEAATTKVTFTLNGYYQGDPKTTVTNKVSGGTILTDQAVVVPFKITDADVVAAFTTNKGAYLIATNRSSSSSSANPNEIDLVDGTTNAPYKVLDMVFSSMDTYVDKTVNFTKNSTTKYQKSRTSYVVAGITLPATYRVTLGGKTTGGTVATAIVPSMLDNTSTVVVATNYISYTNFTTLTTSPAITITNLIYTIDQPSYVIAPKSTYKPNFAVQAAGVNKSSKVYWADPTTKGSDTSSASFNNVVGTASVIPAHATNASPSAITGVIYSGVIKAVKSN